MYRIMYVSAHKLINEETFVLFLLIIIFGGAAIAHQTVTHGMNECLTTP